LDEAITFAGIIGNLLDRRSPGTFSCQHTRICAKAAITRIGGRVEEPASRWWALVCVESCWFCGPGNSARLITCCGGDWRNRRFYGFANELMSPSATECPHPGPKRHQSRNAWVLAQRIPARRFDLWDTFFLTSYVAVLALPFATSSAAALLMLGLYAALRDRSSAEVRATGSVFSAIGLASLLLSLPLQIFPSGLLANDAHLAAGLLRVIHPDAFSVGNLIETQTGQPLVVEIGCSSASVVVETLLCWFVIIRLHRFAWQLSDLIVVPALGGLVMCANVARISAMGLVAKPITSFMDLSVLMSSIRSALDSLLQRAIGPFERQRARYLMPASFVLLAFLTVGPKVLLRPQLYDTSGMWVRLTSFMARFGWRPSGTRNLTLDGATAAVDFRHAYCSHELRIAILPLRADSMALIGRVSPKQDRLIFVSGGLASMQPPSGYDLFRQRTIRLISLLRDQQVLEHFRTE
jgi:hypothetical protein